MYSFITVVQAHRTSSNLLKMNNIRESEVRRVFSHKFGVVQAHRTSSNRLKMNDIRERRQTYYSVDLEFPVTAK